ncbi:RNA polymerase sigma factor [Wenzhouxiangella sp. EGI_FJ10409]|uniref:RNA polymerase sigma factor n=1 Tax=Wenzhouxiangella sp. EGI_FJ10409 TaxID=3243767 RepID=UPI0035DE067E
MPEVNQALEQLISDHQARLVRIARQYAGPNDWQDLLQEITVALWKGLPGFEGRSHLSTWVYRVAVNTALQFVRKRRPATGELSHEPAGSTDVGDDMALLESFLARLDPVNRAVLLMDLEGLSREEIAEVLGISPGAVAVRMTRLKQRFNDEFVEEG